MSCADVVIGIPWSVSEALAALQQRLNDVGGVHWTTSELQRYMREGLRTLSAYTQRYRNRASFSTSAAQPFYDLPTQIPTLRGYTVTSQDLILDIQYALMEPPNSTTWVGTDQFNMALVLEAINSRLQQFLLETGMVQTRTVTAATPDVSGRIVLDALVMTIRRVAWTDAGVTTPLRRDDEWGMTHYAQHWPTTFPPEPSRTWPTAYSVGVTPPLTVQLAPAPPSPGSLDMLAVSVGATLTTSPVLLGIPDDWSWVIKWGALAELLSRDGVAYDPTRASYCEERWKQGVQMARMASVVLNAVVNGNIVTLRSLSEMDTYRRNWQNAAAGVPTTASLAGQNILVISPTPDFSYTISLDVVQNVPVFQIDNLTDCVSVDEPMRDVFLDYCQHLAVWKEGDAQAQSTMALFERFQRLCGVQQMVDAASVPTRGPLLQQTVQDERFEARVSGAEPTVVN